ncbi:glycosyltransferase [uncultured Dysgonomonas sp.]|uniref:Glycosyl transferase family 1 domain-containing protein n=1 Tax=uncultured Dysgonomonas sp. TaxID=206096 RepID=A0A212J8J1_9BACT|nr:glycosyltransferase [uncultured Dysgonomonas sp.]SBV95746.1 conserved hypothetical protein [uncultured Dysgonomonas sp.]
MEKQNIYFAWIKFQRRAVSMQSYFDYNCKHITSCFKNKYFRVLDYIIKSIKTFVILCKEKPKTVWIQLPPIFLLNLLLFYKKYFNKEVIIISDCHNGVFFGKWKKYFDPDLLNKSDIIVVHNTVIRGIAIDMGLNAEKTIILEDKPAEKNIDTPLPKKESKYTSQVLMPCGFSKDEPLEVVFEAARQIPDIHILISGPKERGISLFDYNKIPDNVSLIGFLPLEEYEIVFRQSDLIMGLTTEDHIQLSVANEATGLEMPMVLSDTQLLRDMFYKGAVYVETLDADSITNGIKKALNDIDRLQNEVRILKIERNEKWCKMAMQVLEKINGKECKNENENSN